MSFLNRFGAATCFILGGLLSLAFAPFDLFPLAPLCLAALFLLWDEVPARRAAALGFWFGAGTFLAGTYWLYISIHVLGQAPIWVALLLMLSLVAIMGLYQALIGYIAARWLPRYGVVRWLVALPALWVLVEWLRGWVLSGFPWMSLGYSQIDSWLAGYAPIGGVYTVSLLVALSAGALAALVRGSSAARICAAVVLSVVWAGGAALRGHEWTRSAGAPLTVSLVQGAIPQDQKWQADHRAKTFELYGELNEQALGSRIVLWPEAALPVLAHEVEDRLAALQRQAHARGSDLVMGILRYDFMRQEFHNSMLALGEQRQWYDKRRLVPFGEFFPVPAFVRRWMRLMSLPYTDMTAGEPDQPALQAGGQKLGATICYEDAYGNQQLAVLREATLLVNITNDAWFGDSTAPHQHLQIARMRALEADRYLLRAANDGITAVIGPHGQVLDKLPQFKPGVLKTTVEPRAGLTWYARSGNIPVILLCLAALVLGLHPRWHRLRRMQ